MRAQGERSEMPVDEGHDLLGQIVGVVADRARVHVLVAAERGEAVGEDEDRRPHLALAREPRSALGDVVAERLPVGVRETRTREPDEVVEHREALLSLAVLRRQPYGELAHVRIAQGIALQDLRLVIQHDERAGGAFGALQGHRYLPKYSRTASQAVACRNAAVSRSTPAT